MANQPRIPRVSIVVPFQRDEAAFEETLLSVLERQPVGCEVIVPHNGLYSDPFELGDEVKFVIARSSNLVDLIRTAYDATTAQFVHVIGTGLKAQADWISHGLEPFERGQIAAVAPTILGPKPRSPVEAGWGNASGLLCKANVNRTVDTVDGCRLEACFYRRQVLGGLLDSVAPAMDDPVAVAYAFGCLLRHAGWSTAVAGESTLDQTEGFVLQSASDAERGRTLAAIHAHVHGAPARLSVAAMIREAIVGEGSVGELIGSLRYRSAVAGVSRMIDLENVPMYKGHSNVLRMPAANAKPDRAAA